MRHTCTVLLFSLGLLTVLAGCGPGTPEATEPPPEPRTLRVMTHGAFDIGEEIIAQFEEEQNARVEILETADAGVMLNQAILSAANPLADVIYGMDNILLGRALDAGILQPYDSPLLEEIPDHLQLDAENRALPVDYGDVCFNYDRAWFVEQGQVPPEGLEDLTKPEYQDLIVVESPVTSSPGLAFLLATVGHFGETGDYTYLDYWADLRENGALVTEGWSEAYYEQFTLYGGGDRPIVLSYASSPPVEVLFSEEAFEEAPTAAVVADGSCFRQIEFVGILLPEGAENRDLAEAWVDHMLGRAFQEDIPLHMFMFPANQNAALPEVFVQFAVIPERPAEVSGLDIEANREDWIGAWTEVMQR